MSVYAGPKIVNDNLVFCIDPANTKNYGLSEVRVLVVAGGGGGGADVGGGGGGGGVIHNPNFSITPGNTYTVTVGAGGARGKIYYESGQNYGYNGENSVFGSLTAIGGGGGGNYNSNTAQVGGSGGGGGGAGSAAAAGTAGQGNSGGSGSGAAYASGGGGGAGAAGQSVTGIVGGSGGNGLAFDISGTSTYYGGGGGGGGGNDSGSDGRGYGGLGGGGTGAARAGTYYSLADNVKNGAPNTGGGGGGTGGWNLAGSGGSGIVIVSYPGPQRAIGGNVTTNAGNTIHTFGTVGSTTFVPYSEASPGGIIDFASANNGSLINGTNFSSSNRGALNFDGVNDYAEISAINLKNSSYTVEAWIKRSTTGSIHGILCDLQYGWWAFYISSGNKLVMYHQRNLPTFAANECVGASNIGTGWTHVAAVFNTSVGMSVYVNGVLDGSNSNTTLFDLDPGRGPQYIGVAKFNDGSIYENFFNGQIAQLKVYNNALTAAQITANFNAHRGRFGI